MAGPGALSCVVIPGPRSSTPGAPPTILRAFGRRPRPPRRPVAMAHEAGGRATSAGTHLECRSDVVTYPWWTIGLILFLLAGPFVLNFVLRWVVAPVLVQSRQRMAVRPTYELTRAEQLTPEMQEFIGKAVRQFAAEGFEVAANFHQPDGVTNAGGVPT